MVSSKVIRENHLIFCIKKALYMQLKKSEKASLESSKVVFVLMGFVFVLSLCYAALEWTEREVTKYEVADSEFLFEEEVEIQQTSQETPPPPTSPGPIKLITSGPQLS